MSYNVRNGTAPDGKNHWQYRRPLVAELLHSQNPDLIGTQEALRFQLDDMRLDCDCFGEIGGGRDDGKTAGEYAAILYRKDCFSIVESGTFWFSESPLTPGSCHWGNRQPRICTWALFNSKIDSSSFYHYNMHLDHRSGHSRKRSIDFLKCKIAERKHDAPVIITGDFNVPEWNHVVVNLRNGLYSNGDRFVDTYRQCNKRSLSGTFNMFTRLKFGPRIDYIFAQSTLNVTESSIITQSFNGRVPSDHFPVSAKISISGTKS